MAWEILGYPTSDAGLYTTFFSFLVGGEEEGAIHNGWLHSWKTSIAYLVFEILLRICHMRAGTIYNIESPLIGKFLDGKGARCKYSPFRQ